LYRLTVVDRANDRRNQRHACQIENDDNVAANVAAEGCDVTKKTGERCSKYLQNPDLQNSGLLNRGGSRKGCTRSGFPMAPMP
jgi:hypothetical protein